MDRQVQRNASDIAAIKKFKDYTYIGGGVNLVLRYKANKMTTFSGNVVSNLEVQEFLLRHPEIQESTKFARDCRSVLAPSIGTACHFLFSEFDRARADEFFCKLSNGAMLDQRDPILILRNKLIRNKSEKAKLPAFEIMAITIKAWNFYREGRMIFKLIWAKHQGEDYPEIR